MPSQTLEMTGHVCHIFFSGDVDTWAVSSWEQAVMSLHEQGNQLGGNFLRAKEGKKHLPLHHQTAAIAAKQPTKLPPVGRVKYSDIDTKSSRWRELPAYSSESEGDSISTTLFPRGFFRLDFSWSALCDCAQRMTSATSRPVSR